jgi:hypothetical protein
MSILKQLSDLLAQIQKKLDALDGQPTLVNNTSMFMGLYKGKIIQVCTDSLLWTGDFQHVENDVVVLSNASAISTSTGCEIVSIPRILVKISLLKISSISIGKITYENTVDRKVERPQESQSCAPIKASPRR